MQPQPWLLSSREIPAERSSTHSSRKGTLQEVCFMRRLSSRTVVPQPLCSPAAVPVLSCLRPLQQRHCAWSKGVLGSACRWWAYSSTGSNSRAGSLKMCEGRQPFFLQPCCKTIPSLASSDECILSNSCTKIKVVRVICSPEAVTVLCFAFVSFWLYWYPVHFRNCSCQVENIRITGQARMWNTELIPLLLCTTVKHNLHKFLN